MKKPILFLSLLIFNLFDVANYSLLIGEVRYVSHSGSNTPPYLTWETAADSIMSAINISSFGDTIYVANGNYQEKVVMIPGLSLIGAGMDSTIIDSRNLATSGFHSVEVRDSCLFAGFNVMVSNNGEIGYGIVGNNNCKIILNKVSGAIRGISTGTGPFVYKNICFGNIYGILNFNAKVTKNIVYVNNSSGDGIWIDASSPYYTPITDSNYVVVEDGYFGIEVSYGTKPTISNNTIILKDPSATGIATGFSSDTTKIFNNLIIAEQGFRGIDNTFAASSILALEYNNYLMGNFDDYFHEVYVIRATSDNIFIKNNVVTNAHRGIQQASGVNAVIQYNNSWNNENNYGGFIPDSTNLSVDPMIINDDTTQGDLDFHLQMYSPLIDAGDPDLLDRDGSRSDIGLYGGPYGEVYTYNDLAPRPPHNVTAVIEQGLVKLTWNGNTEADFSHYRIYRDTVSNFIYDTTKIIGETTDTVYYDNLPPVNGEKNYYYLITAFDNQGNQSYPSEEVTVQVTGLAEHPPIGSDGYRLLSNYPNPFNPSTIIPYRLKEGGYVKLYIYDIKGELVTTLVNQWQNKGYYEVVFRPTAAERQRAAGMEVPIGPTYSDMASGVYLYMIMVSNERNIPVFSDMGKMILLK